MRHAFVILGAVVIGGAIVIGGAPASASDCVDIDCVDPVNPVIRVDNTQTSTQKVDVNATGGTANATNGGQNIKFGSSIGLPNIPSFPAPQAPGTVPREVKISSSELVCDLPTHGKLFLVTLAGYESKSHSRGTQAIFGLWATVNSGGKTEYSLLDEEGTIERLNTIYSMCDDTWKISNSLLLTVANLAQSPKADDREFATKMAMALYRVQQGQVTNNTSNSTSNAENRVTGTPAAGKN